MANVLFFFCYSCVEVTWEKTYEVLLLKVCCTGTLQNHKHTHLLNWLEAGEDTNDNAPHPLLSSASSSLSGSHPSRLWLLLLYIQPRRNSTARFFLGVAWFAFVHTLGVAATSLPLFPCSFRWRNFFSGTPSAPVCVYTNHPLPPSPFCQSKIYTHKLWMCHNDSSCVKLVI